MIAPLLDPLGRHLRAADIPMDRLAASTQLDEKAKIGEASRQFEAILVRQILSEARPAEGKKGVASGIYQDMITTQTADNICRSGGLGLARTFEQQLSHDAKAGPGTAVSPGRVSIRETPVDETEPGQTGAARHNNL
jgi:Rod binding domain-containing protein